MAQASSANSPAVTVAECRRAVTCLEALVDDADLLAQIPPAEWKRLMIAAGRLSRPAPEDKRRVFKAFRRFRKRRQVEADRQAREGSLIREARVARPNPAGVYMLPRLEPAVGAPARGRLKVLWRHPGTGFLRAKNACGERAKVQYIQRMCTCDGFSWQSIASAPKKCLTPPPQGFRIKDGAISSTYTSVLKLNGFYDLLRGPESEEQHVGERGEEADQGNGHGVSRGGT